MVLVLETLLKEVEEILLLIDDEGDWQCAGANKTVPDFE